MIAEIKYKKQYNEQGEVISTNGFYTGHKCGTPTQCALGEAECEDIIAHLGTIMQDAIPNSMPEVGEGGEADPLTGTWEFHESLSLIREENVYREWVGSINFTSGGVTYNSLAVSEVTDNYPMINYESSDGHSVFAIDGGEWMYMMYGDDIRTIAITSRLSEVDNPDYLMEFLNKYATKIA